MLKLIDQTVCLISDAEKGNCPLWVYSNRDKQIDMGQRSRLDSQSKYTMLSKQIPRIKTQRLDQSFTRSPSKSNLKLDWYLTINSITMVKCTILIRSHPPGHFFTCRGDRGRHKGRWPLTATGLFLCAGIRALADDKNWFIVLLAVALGLRSSGVANFVATNNITLFWSSEEVRRGEKSWEEVGCEKLGCVHCSLLHVAVLLVNTWKE